MNGIKLLGTGMCVPSTIVTNDDMAQRVDTSEEWIVTRTGIRHRHHLAPGENITDITIEAARRALDSAGIAPEQIGACIVATLTPDTICPSAACMVQRALGFAHDTLCFDLNAACTGFLFALHTMECLLNASPKKYGLVIGAENLSRVTNWKDRGTCILFGDGAGAAVVESRPEWPAVSTELGCHGMDDLLRIPGVEKGVPSHIYMEGTRVFKFAVKAVPYCIERVLEKSGAAVEDVDFFVFHQANARIIDLVVKKYHIPEEKYYKNIQEYGNTSAASIPLVLAELQQQGRVHSGSRVLVVGFGGGLTWGGALVDFA